MYDPDGYMLELFQPASKAMAEHTGRYRSRSLAAAAGAIQIDASQIRSEMASCDIGAFSGCAAVDPKNASKL
jgi:hypothetical protein